MKLFTDAAEYALRAVVWLADHPGRGHTVQAIADGTRTKRGYLVKVLQALARADIVRAQRGVGGGVVLAREPGAITILSVINAVDPVSRITSCPLGLPAHGARLCSLHRRVDQALGMIEREFAETTILELLEEEGASRPLCEVKKPARGGVKTTLRVVR